MTALAATRLVAPPGWPWLNVADLKTPGILAQVAQPGDVLLYTGAGVFGWWTRWKTWSDVGHTETWLGPNEAAASRSSGVNLYPVTVERLRWVLRPTGPWEASAARRWQMGVNGQRYDTLGLLVFYLAKKAGAKDRMFCSEHTTRLARHAGHKPFADCFDADLVAPSLYRSSATYVPLAGPSPAEAHA
jgi:hypothetical protein